MHRPDAMQLRQFYSSLLGRLVRLQLTRAVREHWPEQRGDLMMGLGYASPVLRPYLRDEPPESFCIVPTMPAAQGGIYWPTHRENRTVLSHDAVLPFADNVINRVVLLHELENVESPHHFLKELWRVMTPGGRMLVIVPNRRTIWSGSPNTPFSYGRPYSVSQLRETLCEDSFTHVQTSTTVFMWPTTMRTVMRLSSLFYTVGRMLFPMMGGLIVMEVEKQIYASAREERARNASGVYIPSMAGQPVMSRG